MSESNNVASEHPEVVKKLTELANQYRKTLGDSLQNMKGTENRPVGRQVEPNILISFPT